MSAGLPPDPPAGTGQGSGTTGRFRRLRRSPALRELLAESGGLRSHLVAPLFVADAPDPEPPRGLPALVRRDVRGASTEVGRLRGLGVHGVLLFGVPATKDPDGREAWNPEGPVARTIREVKRSTPDIAVIADVCLCEYTDHGHCGVVVDGRVDNDRTLPLLGRAAVAYARAGADLVAPSAMMDFQVRAIRSALDDAGFPDVGILAYAAKFASGFYGPFRDAAGSTPSFGDRKGYQLDPRNRAEALRELRQDEQEGADVLMVKPALPYLDVLAAARAQTDLPVAAYQVSGEYAMIKAAAQQGWLDESTAVRESLTAIRRAGASLVVSYFAGEAAALGEER